MSRVSRRSLTTRLAELRIEETLDDVLVDDLAARLQSLAVAASFEVGAKKGRLRRKFVAAIGSIGVIGWMGVTGAAASVGLATTGNLPAPVQDVVSTVFEVVGIDLPTSNESDPTPIDEPATIDIEESPVDSSVSVDDPIATDTTLPVDSSITPETSIPDVVDDGVLSEETPVASARPGNSGNTPAVTAPGQVDRDEDKVPPGQVDRDEDKVPPGQVDRDEDKVPPGQVGRDEDKVPPGQVKKNVDGDDSSDDESSSPGKSGDAPGRNKKDDD